jgi:hypothetical protein
MSTSGVPPRPMHRDDAGLARAVDVNGGDPHRAQESRVLREGRVGGQKGQVGSAVDRDARPAALEQLFANLIGKALNYLDPGRPGQIASASS